MRTKMKNKIVAFMLMMACGTASAGMASIISDVQLSENVYAYAETEENVVSNADWSVNASAYESITAMVDGANIKLNVQSAAREVEFTTGTYDLKEGVQVNYSFESISGCTWGTQLQVYAGDRTTGKCVAYILYGDSGYKFVGNNVYDTSGGQYFLPEQGSGAGEHSFGFKLVDGELKVVHNGYESMDRMGSSGKLDLKLAYDGEVNTYFTFVFRAENGMNSLATEMTLKPSTEFKGEKPIVPPVEDGERQFIATNDDYPIAENGEVSYNGKSSFISSTNEDLTEGVSFDFEIVSWNSTNDDWANYITFDYDGIELMCVGLNAPGSSSTSGAGIVVIGSVWNGVNLSNHQITDIPIIGKHHIFMKVYDNRFVFVWNGQEFSFDRTTSQTLNKDYSNGRVSMNLALTGQTLILEGYQPGNSVAEIAGFKIDGVEFAGYSSDINEYNVELPYGTQYPTISIISSDAYSLYKISTIENGWNITIMSEDGTSSKTVKVLWHVSDRLIGTTALLRNIKINGKMLSGFNKNTFDYEVKYDGDEIAVVTASEVADSYAVVTVVQATEIYGRAIITVVSEDGQTTNTYTVTFVKPDTQDQSGDSCNNGCKGSVGGFAISGLAIAAIALLKKKNDE